MGLQVWSHKYRLGGRHESSPWTVCRASCSFNAHCRFFHSAYHLGNVKGIYVGCGGPGSGPSRYSGVHAMHFGLGSEGYTDDGSHAQNHQLAMF